MKFDASEIVQNRMANLYLSQKCPDILTLSSELLGLHSWFYRNVRFSALIRGADISFWKSKLIKTWLYRGTLHGVNPDDLSLLLSLHPNGNYLEEMYGTNFIEEATDYVLRLMEEGINSRKEMREIFAEKYTKRQIDNLLSPWGGIFIYLARQGKVAFCDMTSRDFDLISTADFSKFEDAFPVALKRYFVTYGPATIADAHWFFGIHQREFSDKIMREFDSFELNGRRYFYSDVPKNLPNIPKVTLLSGFDPLIVSYSGRGEVLPEEYKKRVILSSGICMPTVAVDGKVAGLWSVKRNAPIVEFFAPQPKRVRDEADALVELIIQSPEN